MPKLIHSANNNSNQVNDNISSPDLTAVCVRLFYNIWDEHLSEPLPGCPSKEDYERSKTANAVTPDSTFKAMVSHNKAGAKTFLILLISAITNLDMNPVIAMLYVVIMLLESWTTTGKFCLKL